MVRKAVVLVLASLVVAAGAIPASAADPPTPTPRPSPAGPRDGKAKANWRPASPATASAAAATPCVNGTAAGFPCKNVDLMANLPLSSMGGGSGSGGWGWTDPQTGKEYAIAGRSNGVSFVDVTDAANPVYLGNLPPAAGNSSWRELNVYNNTVYVVSEAAGSGLQIFDLTRLRNVTNPPVTFNADARNTSFGHAHTVSVNYDTGLVYADGSDTCSGGPRMFDARADRLNPPFVGCVSADGYTHDSQTVLYHGPDARYQGREIMFNSNEDTLTLFDITTRSSPVQVSRKSYSGAQYVHQGWLTPDHRYFFLNDELDEQRAGHGTWSYVWDVSDLQNPVLLGHYTGPTAAIDHNEFTKDKFVFQSNYTAGLRILDATNAANPQAVTEAAFFDVHPASDSATFNGTWTNYPYFPSGNVAVYSIERGLFVLRPNLGGSTPATVFSDDFEADRGWGVNPSSSDTASVGQWQRGDPESTSYGGTTLQLGTTTSGVNDLVTGASAGGGAGTNDIDAGTTSVQSPPIALPANGTLTLSFQQYFAHLDNATNADFLRVRVVSGATSTTVFEQFGSATNRAGVWSTTTANLFGMAGQTVRIVIEVADAAGGSLVEAGIDDVRITQQ